MSPRRPLRIFFVAGPGDVVGTYRHWAAGQEDPGQVHRTYSGQFFDLCREVGAEAYVLAYNARRDAVDALGITIRHRPIPFKRRRALLYHLGQVWYGLRMIVTAVRFRADLAIIDGGTHWFTLRPLSWFGVRVVPALFCVLWPKYGQMSRINRWVHRRNAPFFTQTAAAILSMSQDITDQVDQMTGGRHGPIFPFLPQYRPEFFADIPAPEPVKRSFRVMYAGRVERRKGVFDLLEIGRRLAAQGIDDIHFDLCGTGTALDELKQATAAAGLEDRFHILGHCNHGQMKAAFVRSHVVIVPTTTVFIEGFNQVVAEGILAGRPVITSAVCPAINYVREAVVEVPPDDVAAYMEAILLLYRDAERYERTRAAAVALQGQFYDPALGWHAALRRLVDTLIRPAGAIVASPSQQDQVQSLQ